MTDQPRVRQRKSHWIRSIGRLIIFYLISWGPITGIYGSGDVGEQTPPWVVSTYRPLDWLRRDARFQRPILVYLRWWRDLLGDKEKPADKAAVRTDASRAKP